MSDKEKPAEQRGMTAKAKIKITVAAIAGVFVLILIFQNLDAVPTRVLWTEIHIPHALLLFIMLLVGFGAGVLVTGAVYRKRAKR
jgi:uncharacterized integral membrane protein